MVKALHRARIGQGKGRGVPETSPRTNVSANYNLSVRKIEVPALVRTRVAGHVAKRMPLKVKIDVEPQAPGAEIVGLLEIEKGLLPFVKSERSEQVLAASQTLEIGYVYASYSVFVTAEQPVTVLVDARSALPRRLLGVIAVVWALTAVAIIILAR